MKITVKYFIIGFITSTLVIGLALFILIKYVTNVRDKAIKEITTTETETLNIQLSDASTFDYNSFKPMSLTDNQILDLDQERFLFINFWATWCAPCIKEFSSLEEMIVSLKTEDINMKFIFVSEEEQNTQLNFLKSKDYNLDFYSVSDDLPLELEHQSIPVTFVLDNEKKIIYRINGAQNWNSELMKKFIIKSS